MRERERGGERQNETEREKEGLGVVDEKVSRKREITDISSMR